MTTKTLVLGRTPARVRAALATLHEDGFAAESKSTDEEARGLLASGEFGVLIVGGGVGRESRAAMKEGTTGSSSARAGAPRARRTGWRSHRSSAPTCRPAYGADPPPEVLAPVHDVAGLGRQRVAGLQVEPDEVEGPLPTPPATSGRRRVDVLRLLAPLVRQCPGRRHRQALGTPLLDLGRLAGGGPSAIFSQIPTR
ncbi:hypothetical protein ACIPQ3_29920 [Streptomyces albidoflavus]